MRMMSLPLPIMTVVMMAVMHQPLNQRPNQKRRVALLKTIFQKWLRNVLDLVLPIQSQDRCKLVTTSTQTTWMTV